MNHPAPPNPQLINSSIYKGQSSVLTIAINWCEHQSHQISSICTTFFKNQNGHLCLDLD
jgi:hypothetical protein